MLRKANRPCREPGCVAYALPGESRCAKHYMPRAKPRSRQAKAWRKEYGTARWRDARAAYLERHPLCVVCKGRGELVSAAVVDHVIPHRGDMTLFWDEKNWQALCKRCHDSKTAKEDGGFGNARADSGAPALEGEGGSISGGWRV